MFTANEVCRDEISNAVTGKTKACFEPTLDYCVVKFPRWPFDKFVYADNTLGTQMKATGEVMAIDNTFEGALMKAVRGCEIKLDSMIAPRIQKQSDAEIKKGVARTDDQRLFHICEALRRGIMTIDEIHEITTMDVFFLHKFQNIIDMEKELASQVAAATAHLPNRWYTFQPEPGQRTQATASRFDQKPRRSC